jgi:ChpA-C
MKKTLCKAAGVGLLAGLGVLVLGASPASADDPSTGPQMADSSAEGDGVLTGNSIAAAIAAPIEICGNSVGLGVLGIGAALGVCDVSAPSMGHHPSPMPGLMGGQVGNLLGSPTGTPMPTPTPSNGGTTTGPQHVMSSAEGDGVAAGNSVAVPVAVPVEVCGNAIGGGVAGLGLAQALCG